MVIITQIAYPTTSVQEMAKRFLEAPQAPEFMTRRGPFINATKGVGIESFSLWELDNSRLAEGMKFLGNYMTIFFGVSGFTYEIRPFYHVDEALSMIGMG